MTGLAQPKPESPNYAGHRMNSRGLSFILWPEKNGIDGNLGHRMNGEKEIFILWPRAKKTGLNQPVFPNQSRRLLVEFDDGANSIGRDFEPNAQDGLFVDTDRGVDDRLRAGQFGVLDHLIHGRSFGLGLFASADPEDIGGRSFSGHGLDHRKVILRKDDIGLHLVLVERHVARSAATADQQDPDAKGR